MPQIVGVIIGVVTTAIQSAAGALGLGGLFTGIGGTILKALIGIGLNYLASLLMKPKKPQGGYEAQLQIGGEIPRQAVFGKCATKGHLVYWNSYGDDNKKLQLVFALSDSVCEGMTDVIVNGESHPLRYVEYAESNAHVEYFTDEYGDDMKIRWWSGAQEVADSELLANANPPDRWTENDQLIGMCYVSVTLTYDKNKYENGIPEMVWVLKGTRLFDPRKAEALGGTGSHVWGNQGTYEWSANPALILYNYLLGIFNYYGAHMVGLQCLLTDLATPLFTAAANICDEDVDFVDDTESPPTTGTEPRYTCHLVVTADQEVREVIESIVGTMAAFTVERGGLLGVIVGAGRIPIDTFTDGDLIREAAITFSAKRSRAQLANAVFGQYTDPDNFYQRNSYPGITNLTYEEEDGGERLGVALDLGAVTSVTQAQRIAKIRLEELRRQAAAQVTLPFNKIWWEAGDWVTWNSARYGLRTWRITRRQIDGATRQVVVDLDEIDSDVYGWIAEEDQGTPSVVPSGPGNGLYINTVSNFTVDVVDGVSMPALEFGWDPIVDQTVDAVFIEYRIVDTLGATRIRDDSPGDGTFVQSGVQPGEIYEARATIITTPPRPVIWTNWVRTGGTEEGEETGPIFATDVLPESIDFTHLSAAMKAALSEVSQTIMRVRDEMAEVEQRLGDAQATQQGTTFDQVSLVKLATENSFGAILHETNLRLSETTALYSSIDAVVLSVEDVDTGLTALGSIVTAQGIDIVNNTSGISVLVTNYNALEARVDDAEGNISAQAISISAQTVRVDQLNVSLTGTATAGGSTSITLQSGSSNQNNYYVGLPITITSGTGAGQTRVITAYNGSTRVATVNAAWTTNPTNGSVYTLGNALGAFAMSQQINTVETSVAGNTATLSTLQTSYNGLAVKYGILGTINGSTGGFLFTGVGQLDGSVQYDFVIAANSVTIANMSNLIRNGQFDAQGLVNPSGEYDIKNWWLASGQAQIDIIDAAGAADTMSTKYCLKLSLSSAFEVYSDYDIGESDAQSRGFAVIPGQKFHVQFEANASTGSRVLAVDLRILRPGGSITTLATWNPSIGTTTAVYEHEFTATVAGRAFLRIQRSSTSGIVYITDVEIFDKNGTKLLVAGFIGADSAYIQDLAIGTLKIGNNAVTVPTFLNVGAGIDPETGTGLGNWITVMQHSVVLTVPSGRDFTLYFTCMCQLAYTGVGGWGFEIYIENTTNLSGKKPVFSIESEASGDKQYSVPISGAKTITSGTDTAQTQWVIMRFRGEATVTLDQRNALAWCVKR